MFSISLQRALRCLPNAIIAVALMSGASLIAGAQTFSTADGSLTFSYPQRWQATESNGSIKIVASDNSSYLLKLDTIETAITAPSAVNDTGLKQAAAKLSSAISSGASFVRASSISMDHGQGASFRFKSTGGDNLDVWIGLIGKHSAVLTPARAGQASQTIGLSVIFQTLTFTDTLPKQPVRKAPKQDMAENTPSSGSPSRIHTVMYSKQIAPILSQRCVACHSNQSASGGLNTASYSAFISGGSRGAIVKPGNVAGSTLIDYLTGARDQMPKGSAPLSAEQIDLFRTWIQEGAANDLDPSSGGVSGGTTTSGAADTPARKRNTSSGIPIPARNAARPMAGGPKPMDSYTGHMASNDTSFDMILYMNGTVTANWTFDKPSPARYEGTYTTLPSGSYSIKLNVASGSIPGGSKTLNIIMLLTGTDAVGKFSLDTTAPNYKIIALQLDKMYGASKSPAPAAGGAANRRRNRPPQ